jgi:hypothetical protein
MISALSEVLEWIADAKTLVVKTYKTGKAIMGGRPTEEDPRFLLRPIDSIAARAKKSILLFPVIVSEGISPAAAGIIARAVQVRCAEYVRLVVTNSEEVDKKEDFVKTLRGVGLGGAGTDPLNAVVNHYLPDHLRELAEAAEREHGLGLRPPLERYLFAEATFPDGSTVDDGPSLPDWEQKWPERTSLVKEPKPPVNTHEEQRPKELPRFKADVMEWKPVELEKANRFLPILLDLTIVIKSSADNVASAEHKLVLGIKGTVHPVPGADLVVGLGESPKRNSFFLSTLRLVSGEISFVSDYVLHLDVARARAASGTSAGQQVLEHLRRNAENNRTNSLLLATDLLKPGFVPPTATIVITADEAAQIRARYGVDYGKIGAAKALFLSHNIMGLMIVDEALGFARVFEDGDENFDRVPLSELENRGRQTELKDILTLMGRN